MNKNSVLIWLAALMTSAISNYASRPDQIRGEAPSLCADGGGIYLSFASGDSIFYTYSSDRGKSFSPPAFVGVLKGLVNPGGRGPQIVCSKGNLLIAAPDKSGNFYTYLKGNQESTWKEGLHINDLAGNAREGFISLGADNSGHIYAVWLDLRSGKGNNLYGAGSADGGKTWSKNKLVYQSPDGGICECCKPAIAMQKQHIAVMFRNNLSGNRDMYLIQSEDGGATFGRAVKLGEGSWKINACPMDGGGLVFDANGEVQTVWRREGEIYLDRQGKKEEQAGKGMKCTIAGINGSYFVAFVNNGKVYCRKPDGKTVELGPGNGYPKLITLDNNTAMCAWQHEKRFYTMLVN